jgi:hypothetical protein
MMMATKVPRGGRTFRWRHVHVRPGHLSPSGRFVEPGDFRGCNDPGTGSFRSFGVTFGQAALPPLSSQARQGNLPTPGIPGAHRLCLIGGRLLRYARNDRRGGFNPMPTFTNLPFWLIGPFE